MKSLVRSIIFSGKTVIIATGLLVAIAVLITQFALTPLLQYYHPQIEAVLSQQLQQPIHFQTITATWSHWHPVIRLNDVSVHDPRLPESVILREVHVTVNVPRSLIQRQLSLANLRIVDAHLAQQILWQGWQVSLGSLNVILPGELSATQQELHGTLELRNVVLRHAQQVLQYPLLRVSFVGQQKDDGGRLLLQQLRHRNWQQPLIQSVIVDWHGSLAQPEKCSVAARDIPVAAWQPLLQAVLPYPIKQGNLVSLRWQSAEQDRPASWSVVFDDLSVQLPHQLSIDHLFGSVSAQQGRTSLQVDSQTAVLHAPMLCQKPIQLARLRLDSVWQGGAAEQLSIKQLTLQPTATLQCHGQTYTLPNIDKLAAELILQPEQTIIHAGITHAWHAALVWRNNKIEKGEIVLGKGQAHIPDASGIVIKGNLPQFKIVDLSPNPLVSRALQWCREINVHIAEFTFLKQHWSQVKLHATQQDNQLAVTLASKGVAGTVRLPVIGNGEIHLALQNLYLQTSNSPLQPLTIADVASLRVQINNLYVDNYPWGNLRFIAKPKQQEVAVQSITLQRPGWRLHANGLWQASHDGQLALVGDIYASNFMAWRKDWGLSWSTVAESGEGHFVLHAAGTPTTPNLQTVKGHLNAHIHEGAITNISESAERKLGLTKMLGVLSVQNIPRRLLLNFKDFGQRGLLFDDIDGILRVNRGVAHLQNVKLKGSLVTAKAAGQIDLVKQTYNVEVLLTPTLNNSLPIIAAIAGGPIAGAATWVASKVVTHELGKQQRLVYAIQGPWHNPVVSYKKVAERHRHHERRSV